MASERRVLYSKGTRPSTNGGPPMVESTLPAPKRRIMNRRKIIQRFSADRKRGIDRSRPRVLILYNEPVLLPGHPDYDSEQEILEMVDAVENNLGQAGFPVSRLGVNNDPEILFAGLKE